MYTRKTSLIFLLFAIYILIEVGSGCASLTGYQDGKTIGEGNGEAMVSLNISQSPEFTDIKDSSEISNIPLFGFPNIELGGRYGLAEKLDLTVKMNTNLNLAIGANVSLSVTAHRDLLWV